jgi:hypothetical protein
MPSQIDSELTRLTRREFARLLASDGVEIQCNGYTKKCLTSAIKEERHQETTGASHHFDTQIDMLAEDFDAFAVKLNVTTVTVDEVTMTVVSVLREPDDPVVHFEVTKDY